MIMRRNSNLNSMVGRDIQLPPQSLSLLNLTFLNAASFHRPWRRRRRVSNYHQLSLIRCSLYSSQSQSQSHHNLFHSFLSQLDLLAPALGFTTSLALAILYNSSSSSSSSSLLSHEIGDWTLSTSPTPFNRFLKLRCPSLLLHQFNKEDDEEVLDKGPIVIQQQILINSNDKVSSSYQYEYQRICVNTDDGGVVSLDWPANLDLSNEHGLDTTILIVPGTADGSMDENVRSFVYDCFNRGCFPIVMNPRGCARSPLTTPRLFTAADSDDICTTVQFINRTRPWTTLVGVGFGYGANMLTKYLAEVGEETPLTAATCLDNPFDLKGAAGSANHHFADQNLIGGLIDILQSNKELFQGRSHGFDVEKALQAKSLKDFEEAISMVSYGFDSIEEFYVSSSTRDVVGNVKIPLLFIQNNAVSSISIPHSLIAENPFTSLLTCTFRSVDNSSTGAVSWCQHLVVEWLTAVELALLKGRHPLLEDTDVTINPSKHLKLMASKASDVRSSSKSLLNNHQLDALDGNISYGSDKMLKRSDAYVSSSSGLDLQKSKSTDKDTNEMVTQTNLVDSEVVKEGDVHLVDGETGKVLRATEVVMNMLDVKMPEALSEEQKHKVLTAVGQGETLMNALQDAVPEDVRGKLTTAATAILQKQKKNVNGVSSNGHGSDVPVALNTKMREGSSQEKEPNASVLNKQDTSKHDASEPEALILGTDDTSKLQTTSHHGGEVSNSATPSHEELGSDNHSADFSKEKVAQFSPIHDSDSSVSSKVESLSSSEDHISEQVKVGHEGGTEVEKDDQRKDAQYSIDQKSISSPGTEESSSTSAFSPENQLTAKEDGGNQKKEELSVEPVPSNSSSSSPSFSVSQALDALTGMDDSTQVAVNSVFSVIEDVITRLEGNRDDESAVGDKDKVEDTDTDTDPESEFALQQTGDGKGNMPTEPKAMGNHQKSTAVSKLSTEKKDEAVVFDNKRDDIPHSMTKLQYRNSLYDNYVQSSLLSNMKNDKLFGSDPATALFLDYVPEEGQWKLLEQAGDGRNYVDDGSSYEGIDRKVESPLPSDVECKNDIIEPAYVILDAEGDRDPVGEYKTTDEISDDVLMQFVKENIFNSLKVEVCRRISATDMKDIAPMLKKELEEVADTISLAVVHNKQHIISLDREKLVGPGDLKADHILDAIASAVQGTIYMKEVIPVGIVVGSTLASLRQTFNIAAAESIGSTEVERDQIVDSQKGYHLQADRMIADKMPLDKVDKNNNFYNEDDGYEEKDVSNSLRSDTVMVGAVTAALGATAMLVHQQDSYSDGLESSTTSSMSFNQKDNHEEHGKVAEETSKSNDQNIVTSLAEKAMSVAAPVVPTKEGGEVDQERLVSLLADLGQRGGILKLVGKLALLWGGIRGAMSLIGKLMSFLRLAERPVFQRILGFISMVLVLWTPVVVPLLPTLVQNWAAHNSSKFTELACIIGLYSSIMVLVVLWGKRIRGYEDPLESYGLKLTSARQIQNFLCGLIGGVMLVLLIQSTNVLLGFVSISWPTIPSSADTVALLKLFGEVLRFVGQGLVTTVSVALVEELLFRSWLPEEIAADLGYNRGIILSGLAFSLSQWSLNAIPGLWLLSVGLAGVRQRCQGSLSLPIGLRTGIMASSFVLKGGGFLIYQPTSTYPLWVSSGDIFQPFNGVVGLAVALLWAAILYPRKQTSKEHQKTAIK